MRTRKKQQGVTIVITLLLLVVMLLGGVALSRLTEVGTLAAGNAAYHEAAVQASEVGVNTAYAAVRALADEENTFGTWYFPQTQAVDAFNVPTINWTAMPEIVVGSYRVRYVVDRLCTTLPVTDPIRQCLNKSQDDTPSAQVKPDDPPDPNSVRLFRITVRVTGPKDTLNFVQSMITRG